MKIGIFGGSFNPPHIMHRDIALELIDKGYLNMVIYVPTGDNYDKSGLIDFNHRFNMLNLMICNKDNLKITDLGNKDEYQCTYQVLDYYKEMYKDSDIYFICGMDNLITFDTWKKYDYILENYKLLVVKRNNENIDSVLEKYNIYRNNIIITDILEKNISSSMIRKSIKIGDVSKYLDKEVYKYIEVNNLYK